MHTDNTIFVTKIDLIKFIRYASNKIGLVESKIMAEAFIDAKDLEDGMLSKEDLFKLLKLINYVDTEKMIIKDNQLQWNRPNAVTSMDIINL